MTGHLDRYGERTDDDERPHRLPAARWPLHARPERIVRAPADFRAQVQAAREEARRRRAEEEAQE